MRWGPRAPSGTLTFAAGQTTKTITVAVKGDVLNEPTETFFVNLSGPINASIAKGQGQGTIVNDDALPKLTINDISVVEGNAGTTNAVFTVTLAPASGRLRDGELRHCRWHGDGCHQRLRARIEHGNVRASGNHEDRSGACHRRHGEGGQQHLTSST